MPSRSRIPRARPTNAQVERELAIDTVSSINGVTFDGEALWIADATNARLARVDPESGAVTRSLTGFDVGAGTAFDGTHLWQAGGGEIRRIDPRTGGVLGSIPAPDGVSGVAYAEGALWVGQSSRNRILKLDPATGQTLKTIPCDRFVTGVSWVDGELWHGTMDKEACKSGQAGGADVRRVDPETGEALEQLTLPGGAACSGMEADREGRLWCGDPLSGKLRAVRRRAR